MSSTIIDENFSLSNQVALVTGASRGIGAAIARELASAGATVILNYKSNELLALKVLEEIKEISPKSEVCGFDVSQSQEVDKAIDEIVKKHGAIHILVSNAGVSREGLLPRSSNEHFEAVFQTNFLGTVYVARAVSRSMMKNRYGRIICMGSVVGETGNRGQSAYASSKAALFGFIKSVAQELGARNVTCNMICPGFIETEMTHSLDENVKQAYLTKIPLGRFGTSNEIAACVHFLASPAAAYVTGATLDINGGLFMR